MWEYQDEGLEFLRTQSHALLGHEPGLGKSKMVLQAAETPLLICAPAMVIDGGVYHDELAKWRPDIDQEDPSQLVVVPYTSLCERVSTGRGSGTKPLERARRELLRREFGTLWLDESHYIKGRNTTWTKAALQMRKRAGRVHLSTGTPIPNWAWEVFTACKFIWPERADDGQDFGSFWRWVAQWFEVDKGEWSKFEIGDPLDDTPQGWLKFYEANLGDRYLARTWTEVLPQVPPMRMQKIECPMAPAQLKAYRALKKDYITWLEETGTEVVAWSSAGLHTKLARCLTGLELLDRDAHGSGKFAQLERLLRDTSMQVFVVGHFRDTAELAAKVAQRAGRTATWVHGGCSRGESAQRVSDFKAGRVEVLCGTIEKVKEGLNFEQVDLVIRIERSWRPTSNDQVAKRIRRVSNLKPKLCLDLVTPNSLDIRMLKVLAGKSDQQMKALRAREFAALL